MEDWSKTKFFTVYLCFSPKSEQKNGNINGIMLRHKSQHGENLRLGMTMTAHKNNKRTGKSLRRMRKKREKLMSRTMISMSGEDGRREKVENTLKWNWIKWFSKWAGTYAACRIRKQQTWSIGQGQQNQDYNFFMEFVSVPDRRHIAIRKIFERNSNKTFSFLR